MRTAIVCLLLWLIVGGCTRDEYFVYEYTCWNGGVVIYQEKLVDVIYGWETLDGYRANLPMGDVACQRKLIGRRDMKKQEEQHERHDGTKRA